MTDLPLYVGLLVVLLLVGVYGIVLKDWRANFGAVAVGVFLLILVMLSKR